MIGNIRVVTISNPDNTLLDIARHYDLGYHEIMGANPGVSPWVPGAGTKVVIPTQFVLPPEPWEGIVVNISQRRLFYFPRPARGGAGQVVTFPISIARPGWSTPLGQTRIIAKDRDPAWIVPKNILEEHRREGEPRFPSYFPPGPDNPMGMLALETGFSEIFIHGTNKPWGVGMRTSHGCLHLYPEDAAELFAKVPVGTPVRIIDQPYSAGVRDGTLYLSASEPVGEYPSELSAPTRAVASLLPYAGERPGKVYGEAGVDWSRLLAAVRARRVMPVPISRGAPSLDEMVAAIKAEPYARAPYGTDANNAAPPLATD